MIDNDGIKSYGGAPSSKKDPYVGNYFGPDSFRTAEVKKSTIAIVHGILQQAMDEVGNRATTYDTPQGEESMPKVVELFNVLYGKELTVEQGWMFMVLLKAVRSSQGQRKMDNYVDLAAYSAFAGKAAME